MKLVITYISIFPCLSVLTSCTLTLIFFYFLSKERVVYMYNHELLTETDMENRNIELKKMFSVDLKTIHLLKFTNPLINLIKISRSIKIVNVEKISQIFSSTRNTPGSSRYTVYLHMAESVKLNFHLTD